MKKLLLAATAVLSLTSTAQALDNKGYPVSCDEYGRLLAFMGKLVDQGAITMKDNAMMYYRYSESVGITRNTAKIIVDGIDTKSVTSVEEFMTVLGQKSKDVCNAIGKVPETGTRKPIYRGVQS